MTDPRQQLFREWVQDAWARMGREETLLQALLDSDEHMGAVRDALVTVGLAANKATVALYELYRAIEDHKEDVPWK